MNAGTIALGLTGELTLRFEIKRIILVSYSEIRIPSPVQIIGSIRQA
jgi:hypothetical protein